jgi:hypothetical protein
VEKERTVSSSEPPTVGVLPERIEARLRDLDSLRERPLSEHPELYQQLHAELQGALADVDDRA